jgi:type II secretory pathway pseudopilin PulG
MSGLEPLAAIALIGGTAASAGSQLMAGGEKAAAAEFESQQYAQQAQAQRTASIQEEAQRRRDLTSNLETIAAIRAGRGVGASSPTAMAIFDSGISQSEDDIAASKANYAAKADLASRASILSQRKASTSLLAGTLGAASSIASGAFRYGAIKSGGAGSGLSLTGTGGLY